MSYVIDVYRREIAPTRNLLDFAVFVAYFPHLVAGPILRASRLLPQIALPRARSRASRCATGLWLIAWGFFQKIFVADNLAAIANTRLRARRASRPASTSCSASYAFAFQIYGDFAGYSNIARGTSKLMGIELHRELPLPVLRAHAAGRSGGTGTSACRRGCATTSTSRSAATAARRAQTRRNLLITMVLGGLWHGAAWTFVLWGAVPWAAAHRLPRRRSRRVFCRPG